MFDPAGLRKNLGNSTCARATTSPFLLNNIVRELVVPWSKARMYFCSDGKPPFTSIVGRLATSAAIHPNGLHIAEAEAKRVPHRRSNQDKRSVEVDCRRLA
ncbi:MAG: hypothetical protein ABI767_17080, partial [Rhodanobacter sp.]